MIVTLNRVKVAKNITFKGIDEFRSFGLSDNSVSETDTRARDQLLVCGVEPKSEFLKDFS